MIEIIAGVAAGGNWCGDSHKIYPICFLAFLKSDTISFGDVPRLLKPIVLISMSLLLVYTPGGDTVLFAWDFAQVLGEAVHRENSQLNRPIVVFFFYCPPITDDNFVP